MELLVETHTHTLNSQHANATLMEMAQAAKKAGKKVLCITDHGPAMTDSPHYWHFSTNQYPDEIDGVKVLKGAEVNIIDYKGRVDLPEKLLLRRAPVIASVHPPVLPPCDDKHVITKMYQNVLEKPYIDILGHCGWTNYEFNIDDVLLCAKYYDKVIEINNNTFRVRPKSVENCKKIAKRCGELGVKIIISTDAHSPFEIGEDKTALCVVIEAGVDESLVLNTSEEKFLDYLKKRNRI